MSDKYKLNEKVRFEFKNNETRVGIIKKIKRGLLGSKYLVMVVYPSCPTLLHAEARTYFYWMKEKEIIENLSPGYKGWC